MFTRMRKRALFAVTLVGVIALGPLASPGSAAALAASASEASGFAVGITIDVPGVPGFEGVDQRIIETSSQLGDVSKALAALGDGEHSVEATSVGSSASQAVVSESFPQATPIFNATAGNLAAALTADKAEGDGVLSSLDVSLVNVHDDLFPDEVKDGFATVTTTMNDTIADANTALDAVLVGLTDEFEAVCLDDPLGLGDALCDTLTTSEELSDAIDLPMLDNLATSTMVDVEDIQNETSAERTTSAVVSDSTAQIGSMGVFGLLHMDAIDLGSHSQAEGTAGSAKNNSTCSVSNLRVGDQDAVAFDGSALYVAGEKVPVPIDEVSAVKTVVDQLMADLGISVNTCDVVEGSVAEDGTSASQTVSALSVSISPQVAGTTIATITVDPAVTTDVSTQVVESAAPVPAADDTPSLPRTGPALLVTILGGLGLSTGALALRRKLL